MTYTVTTATGTRTIAAATYRRPSILLTILSVLFR